jgi:hypothetical protein
MQGGLVAAVFGRVRVVLGPEGPVKVTIRDDADDLALLVNHRNVTDLFVVHQKKYTLDQGVFLDGENLGVHQIAGTHKTPLLSG